MVERIEIADAQAWAESTKLTLGDFDASLIMQVENYVISKLEGGFNPVTWVDPATTPEIVKQVIAMKYVSVIYDRTYSEDSDSTNPWAARLDMWAEDLIDGMLAGSIAVDGYIATDNHPDPVGFPTDASSAPQPTHRNVQWSPNHIQGNPSDQPPLFSMGMRF